MVASGAPRGAPTGDPQGLGLVALKEGLLHAQANGAQGLSLAFGRELLDRFAKALKDEVWAVYESVYLAALALNNAPLYKRCYTALAAKWGGSSSSKRVKGLLLLQQEAAENPQKALQLLGDHLKLHPGDVAARRRVVAVYKQQANYKNCISFLIAHLSEYAGDKEAWHELAELYIHLGLLQQAAFVWEELLLREPNNLYYLLSYGEIQCSLQEPALGCCYFSRVLLADPPNTRALWDLLLGAEDLLPRQEACCSKPQKQQQQQGPAKQQRQRQQQQQQQQRRRTEEAGTPQNFKTLVSLGLQAAARLDAVYTAQQQERGKCLFAAAAKSRIAAISQSLKDYESS